MFTVTGNMPDLWVHLLLLFPLIHSQKVCIVEDSIGNWLQDNSGPCEVLQGHFDLDETANNLTTELYSAFSGLKRIEGCIHVKNYAGSRNLSFFSALEEVDCDKEKARASNYSNVITVIEPFLDTMGFESLKTVKGPGAIRLSFEKQQIPYSERNMTWTDLNETARHCFSKKELLFLMKHSKFEGQKMYQPCDIHDPCQRLELFKGAYNFSEIPANCTDLFVGSICILGPYEQNDPIFDKFRGFTNVIGQIEVAGTFWNNLSLFRNLETIRDYAFPDNFNRLNPCAPLQDGRFSNDKDPFLAGYNRFLNMCSFPELGVAKAVPRYWYNFLDRIDFLPFGFDYYGFDVQLDLTVPDKFHACDSEMPFTQVGTYNWLQESEYFGWFLASLSLFFSFRAILYLIALPFQEHLPKFQFFLVILIILVVLLQLESCVFNERAFYTQMTTLYAEYIFPEFSNRLLLYPLITFLIKILATLKYAAMMIIIFCYMDVVLFYSSAAENAQKYSKYFVGFSSVIIFAVLMLLYQQLYITVPQQRPDYQVDLVNIAKKGLNKAIYIPFIMHVDGIENFTYWISDGLIPHYLTILKFPNNPDVVNNFAGIHHDPEDMQLDILGGAFPNYSFGCDLALSIFFGAFLILRKIKFVHPPDKFHILILLYLQISMFRIREFILRDIMYDMNNYVPKLPEESYAIPRDMQQIIFDPNRPNEFNIFDKYNDENYARFLRILEKFPAITMFIVSYYCWKFTRFHCYLSSAMKLRKRRKSVITLMSDGDHTDLTLLV